MLSAIETAIVECFIAAMAARGWHCHRRPEEVCGFIAEMGQRWIPFKRPVDGARAWVLFIEGNGEDIISAASVKASVFDGGFSRDFDAACDVVNDRLETARG